LSLKNLSTILLAKMRALVIASVTRPSSSWCASLLALLCSMVALGGCGKTTDDGEVDVPAAAGGSSSAGGSGGAAPTSTGSELPISGAGGVRSVVEGDPWEHGCAEDRAAAGGGTCVPAPEGCVLGGAYLLTGSSCNLSAECAGTAVSVHCGRGKADPWSCTCDGKEGFLELEDVADDGSACHVALELCPTDYLAGAACDLTEESKHEEDECDSTIECSVTRELFGLTVTASDLSSGLCEREGSDWICSCEGSNSALFKLTAKGGEASVDACSHGARVCDAFRAREPETPTRLGNGGEDGVTAQGCTAQWAEGDAESCNLVANCYLEPEQWAGLWVAPWSGRAVACERSGDGWSCTCEVESSFLVGKKDEVPPEAAPCLEHLIQECGGAG
jgi:hypothetical protein